MILYDFILLLPSSRIFGNVSETITCKKSFHTDKDSVTTTRSVVVHERGFTVIFTMPIIKHISFSLFAIWLLSRSGWFLLLFQIENSPNDYPLHTTADKRAAYSRPGAALFNAGCDKKCFLLNSDKI